MLPDNIFFQATDQFQSQSSATYFLPAPSPPMTHASDGDDTNMAFSPIMSVAMTTKKPLDISSLMSPPELLPMESFHQSSSAATIPPSAAEKRPTVAPPSPPISPPSSSDADSIEAAPAEAQDPILYPNGDAGSSPRQPLFGRRETDPDTERAIDSHMTARPTLMFRATTPPRREEYELTLFFRSSFMKEYERSPREWLRTERKYLLADRQASSAWRAKQKPKKPVVQPTRPSSALRPSPTRIVKPDKLKPKPKRIIRAAPARIAPQTTSTPVRQPGIRLPSATPEARRTVAPNREDKDFLERPDYCPPLDTLPSKANSLKVDWKGNALDLSQDPHRHHLHPDELILAANLRLDCATYLTSKRRIFERRLECARINKEFRKTDAQQACKIDVNKASKLWTAYDKVGWLNIAHMAPFMK